MENSIQSPDFIIIKQGSRQQCQEISLLLSSQGIPHWTHHNPLPSPDQDIHWVGVERDLASLALEQIRLYEEENTESQGLPLAPLSLSWHALWILSIPFCTAMILSLLDSYRLKAQGINDTRKVLQGEWWRVFTAQTLHADAHHLASNLISGFFILSLLAYRIALPRVAGLLALLAALANTGVALTLSSDFRSLGFSTYVFATLGMLASLEWRLLPPHPVGLLKRLEPLLAAFLIAVMMGLGENSDILGHFYGLICGILGGLIIPRSWIIEPSPSIPWFQNLLGFLIYGGLYAIAWGQAV